MFYYYNAQIAEQVTRTAQEIAAKQQAEYERQCEIFRCNQGASGVIIDGGCKHVEKKTFKRCLTT